MQEIFKDIPTWEGRYQVSNLGQILSLRKNKDNLILKQDIGKKGYCRVSLCRNGKVTRLLVHRIVGEVFVNNPQNKPQINHLDNNPENNNSTNLEWSTQIENMIHSTIQGRQDLPRQLGCIAASKINEKKSENRYRQMLGSNFIAAFTERRGKAIRRIVTFNCPECSNTFTERVDSVALRERNGICSACYRKKI